MRSIWATGVKLRAEGLGLKGFRVQGSGFRVQGLGFRVRGLGFRVSALGSTGIEGRTSANAMLYYPSCGYLYR